MVDDSGSRLEFDSQFHFGFRHIYYGIDQPKAKPMTRGGQI